MEKQDFVAVASVQDLKDDQGTCVNIGDRQIALFKGDDGTVYAIGNICPHQGGPLAEGWFDADDCSVTCPLHAWDFDVRTGKRVNGPETTPRYEVRVEKDVVMVSVNSD